MQMSWNFSPIRDSTCPRSIHSARRLRPRERHRPNPANASNSSSRSRRGVLSLVGITPRQPPVAPPPSRQRSVALQQSCRHHLSVRMLFLRLLVLLVLVMVLLMVLTALLPVSCRLAWVRNGVWAQVWAVVGMSSSMLDSLLAAGTERRQDGRGPPVAVYVVQRTRCQASRSEDTEQATLAFHSIRGTPPTTENRSTLKPVATLLAACTRQRPIVPCPDNGITVGWKRITSRPKMHQKTLDKFSMAGAVRTPRSSQGDDTESISTRGLCQ
ncbi:hypothetical protein C0Q70_15210 [Pomacea canaliculata]|uniref:Uncharacterized protein n=1 Tax=Pomacea canaliculata TaxID=400727 RepID=A0A2T7NU98_POMCA|nr:hypothetical protein C0Q70_15210 [Pomacea canaliculata]